MIRKGFCALLALVLLLNMLPAGVVSAKIIVDDVQNRVDINPEYIHTISEADVAPGVSHLKNKLDGAGSYLPLEEAGAVVREAMKAREETVTVSFYVDANAAQSDVFAAVYAAMEHTGVPTEGDYISKNYYTCNASYYSGSGKVNGVWTNQYEVTYTLTYLTNAAQEAEMDAAVEELLASLDYGSGDDYSKFMAVYDYICENITYDYDNLEDTTYLLKHTAYAALVDKTAVCQGYAVLLYRLMLELGIDCRYISGDSGGPHGWNIVRMGNFYYNADSTWDAGSSVYSWCLLSDANFTNHVRDAEYRTNAFYEAYPMGIANYDPDGDGSDAEAAGICGDNLTWILSEDGVLTIEGSGEMYNYGYYGNGDSAPWAAHKTKIKELVIEDTVTSIGHEAFAGCTALTSFVVPIGVYSIGYKAFANCTGLGSLTVGSTSGWYSVWPEAFSGCTNLKDLYISQSAMLINAAASWWEASGLLVNAERIYANSSVEPVSEVIYQGFTCTNAVENATVGGVSYKVYTKGSHSFITTVIAPTCEQKGQTDARCQFCNYGTTTYVDALGHSWDENNICRTCGEMMAYLVDCNLVVKDLIIIDGVYHTADGHPVVIALDAPILWLSGYTLKAFVDGYGTEYFSMTYWDQLLDAMNEEGFVPLTEETMVWFLDLIGGNPAWNEDESDLYRYLGIDLLHTHSHSYDSVVTAPTCTEQGYTTYTCACGDSYVADYTDAKGHSFGQWYEETAPTCTEKGVQRRDCANCGASETEDVAALGHSYVASVTDPTCAEQGYTIYTCVRCGDNYVTDFTPIVAHSFGQWYEEAAPSCTEKGVQRRDCANCEATETRDVAALGHDYTETVVEPTCAEQGYTLCTCVHCGDNYVTDFTPVVEHSFGQWYEEAAPSCTEKGVQRRDCANCEATETRDVAALGHDYAGSVTDATCTEPGYTTYTCRRCGDSYIADDTAPKGHSFGEWVTIQEPTCEAPGVQRRTCACGETERKEISKLAHNFVDGECTECGAAAGELGDANGDGKIDTTDAKLIMQYDLGLIGEDAINLAAMDVNGDGKVDTTDAKLIMQLDLGLITEFPKP